LVNIPIPQDLKDGSGNCEICSYNPKNNPKCKGYIPCRVFDVIPTSDAEGKRTIDIM